MRIVAIVNHKAGTVVAGDLDEETLRGLFAEAGVEADVRFLPGDEICDVAREAVAGGADAVVAGGGDGTIRAVASVLAGGKVPMGVLPLGTLNHFARDLLIPTDLPGAVGVIANGQVRSLDLGDVNGEIFVNNSVLGFYPPVVQVRDWERRKLDRNKWLATLSAAVKVLPKLPTLHVQVRAEGLNARRSTHFLFVGNNEYQMNAFSFGARNRFDSGDLYVYIAKTSSRLSLLGLAFLALVRDLTRSRSFDSWRLSELTVETRHKKAMAVYLDGEVTVLTPPLRYTNRSRALPVIVPAS
jgi:diacylglycerol kinase family enzyme